MLTETGLRIALITETFAPEVNGVAMTLGRICTGLQERGHSVSVTRPRLPVNYQNGCHIPHYDATGDVYRPGFQLPNYPELRIGAWSYPSLIGTWRHNKPDLVHVATEGPMGLSAILAARTLGLPLTSSFHTNFHEYTEHYRMSWLGKPIFQYLRSLHNMCACTMVPTLKQARELQNDGYKRVCVLSRGIDEKLFYPERRNQNLRNSWGVDDDTLVLCTVGRLAAEKNLALSVRALRAAQKVYPKVKLVLVGDGPFRKQIENEEDVILAGMRCDADLAAHYASADIFLFPSTTETYGNVLVEAMASGLASVAFDYAAAHEIVRDGYNGSAPALNDEAAFIQACCDLVADPAKRKRYQEHGVKTARRRTWSAVLDQFLESLHRARAHKLAASDKKKDKEAFQKFYNNSLLNPTEPNIKHNNKAA